MTEKTRGLIELAVPLLLALVLVVAASWSGARHARAGADALLSEQTAELTRLKSEIQVIEARADSLAAVALERADTVRVAVERWRTLTDTLRLRDTVWVRQLIGQGDDVVRSCTLLADECTRALAAKDSALAAEQHQARLLEEYRAQLASRLKSEGRKKWLYGAGGVVATLAVCRAAR